MHYTPLVGVIGEGEEHRPPHPQREALTRLLLERGAVPYDVPVFYNVHFHGDIRWLLELIYAQVVKSGRQADWDDPNWSMIDMVGYGSGARYLLSLVVACVAAPLIERGAEIDCRDSNHQATPLWFAVWDQRPRMIALLSRFGRDVRSLTFTGNVERLREVLSAEPALARAVTWGQTLLIELPGDEARALEIVDLLLAHGADPMHKNNQGMTAAECAKKRGLGKVTELLRVGHGAQ